MGERLTIAQAAKRLGVHRSNVSRPARQWRLIGDDGRVDLEELIAHRDIAGRNAKTHATAGEALTASTNLRRLQADRLELRIARERGELVRRADVVRALTTAGQKIRDAFLAVPAGLAQDLVGISDVATAKAIIDERLRSTLNAYANDLEEQAFNETRDAADAEN